MLSQKLNGSGFRNNLKTNLKVSHKLRMDSIPMHSLSTILPDLQGNIVQMNFLVI